MADRKIVKLTMDNVNELVEESIKRLIAEKPFLPLTKNDMLTEMGMKKKKFSDKFSEVTEELADDIISICLYPHSQSISHWKGCAIGLCRRFVAQDIDPLRDNTYEIRKTYLLNGLYEKLNDDFSAVYKRILGVIDYYEHKEDNERLAPNMDAKSAYLHYLPIISKTLLLLVEEIAKENYEGIREIMINFNPNN